MAVEAPGFFIAVPVNNPKPGGAPMNLKDLATALRRMESQIDAALHEEAKHVATTVEAQAKALIGHEQPEWPPLAEATIEDKARNGYDHPAPLLRTGEMRDSIQSQVIGVTAHIGSDDPKAVAHEYGTPSIPARPMFQTAWVREQETLTEHFAQTINSVIKGGNDV